MLRTVFAKQYLSQDILDGFDKYKYSSKDTSPFSVYVMHPFWNTTVKIFPMWLAPNVMTFTGYLMLVLLFLILSYYDYHFNASSDTVPDVPQIPSWVWLFGAICNFMSHTLDGCDGKQARRTGSSSPLGELFDHGLDSWATMFLPIALFSIFGTEDYGIPPFRFFLILLVIQLVFIMSHFEKYNTGVLFLPWGYDISQVLMCIIYVITYYLGYEFWKFNIPYFDFSVSTLFELAVYGGSIVLSGPMTAYNIYVAYKSGNGRQSSVYEALLPMFSTIVLFVSMLVWAAYSPSNILQTQLRLYLWLNGTLFSNIASRLIVNQMSSTRCEAFNLLLYPVLVITAAVLILPSYLVIFVEKPFLIVYVVLSTLVHVHYGYSVVNEMALHFKINVFSIKRHKN